MDVAPGCFIASWKRLGVSSQPVKDILQIPRARDCAPAVFGFRLNIIITEYQKHLGCMFRCVMKSQSRRSKSAGRRSSRSLSSAGVVPFNSAKYRGHWF